MSVHDSASDPRPRFPLRAKLMILATTLAVVPAGVIGYRLIDVNTVAVEEMSRELQLAVLDDLSRTISRELADSQDGLHAVGRVLSDDGVPEELAVPQAMALLESVEPLDQAAVYDSGGHLLDVIRQDDAPELEHLETLAEALRQTAAEANAAVGDAELRAGEPRLPLVVPIRAQGQVTGYVATWLSLLAIQTRVERLAAARFDGQIDSVFVVDRERRLLAHPDGARARRLEQVQDLGILEAAGNTTSRRDVITSGEHLSENGTPMLASSMRVPGRPWTIVAQVPLSVAYASIGQMRTTVIVTVSLAVVLALLVGLLISGRITAPVAELTRFAGSLSRREFTGRTEVRTNDELALLANAMDRAAEDLAESEFRLREELEIRSDLGRYLPGELVEKIVKREQNLALGGERRKVTVLFADVVAFTPLTEKRPPEEIVTVLNELFTILTGIVFRHGGMVDKFIGDCVMALWGAAEEQEDHAERALAAAEDMLSWLETGNATWQERFDITIQLAIGVHSGEAVVGNIGSESRMEYTAIGDAVNVAARLESLARPQQILVSGATRELGGEDFDFAEAGSHEIPGRELPLELFELRI